MATPTFKAKDGRVVSADERVELTLAHGASERAVRGTVRAFEPNARRIAELEAELARVRADNDVRWEIVPDEAGLPAVGFLPENVLKRSGS